MTRRESWVAATRLALVLRLLTLAGASHADEGAACQGRELGEVRIGSCTLDQCADEGFRRSLVALPGLAPGERIGRDDLARTRRRLLALEVFTAVDLRCEPQGSGHRVDLVLDLKGRVRIEEVSISGNRYLYQSDLRKRVYLRAGQYLADVRPDAEIFASQATSLLALYEREGFEGTRVSVVPVPLEGARARVEIRIEPGQRHLVQDVRVAISDEGRQRGCLQLEDATVRAAFPLRAGQTVTPRSLKAARRDLVRTLWGRGYLSPKVEAILVPEEDVVDVRVRVRRCARIQVWVPEAEAKGGWGEDEDEDSLLGALTFDESGSFDWEEAEIGRQGLVESLRQMGHVDARVVMEHRQGPFEDMPAVMARVDYFVERGPVPVIDRVTLRGRAGLSEELLRQRMDVEEYSLFSRGGTLLVDQVFSDLTRIADLYREQGFLAFRFTGATRDGDEGAREGLTRLERRREGAHQVWRWVRDDLAFEVVRTEGERGIELVIPLEEGTRSLLTSFLVEGAREVSEADVLAALPRPREAPWSGHRMREIEEGVQHLYRSRGYSGVRTELACADANEPERWTRCDPARLKAAGVRMRVRIEEGTRAQVGDVLVLGHRVTAEGFIRSRLPRKGDPYDLDRIQAGITELRDTGVFASVQVRAIGPDETPPATEVALVAVVEEGRYQFFDFAVGFETINRPTESAPAFVATLVQNGLSVADAGLVGSEEPFLASLPDLLITGEVAYSNLNFLGRARQLQVPLKYGFSMTHPLRYASLAPTYIDPFVSAARVQLQLTPFVIYDRATEAIDKFLVGLNSVFSKTFQGGIHASIGHEISGIRFRLPDDPVLGEWSTMGLQNKVLLKSSWSRLDNPITPSRGVFAGTSVSYLNALQQGSFRNYIKWDLQLKGFVPVRRWVVLGAMVRYADSRSFEGAALPVYERYKLGGSKGLRGFEDDAVTPYTSEGQPLASVDSDDQGTPVVVQAFGGDVLVQGSLEARVPVWRSVGLEVGAFFDWGGLAETTADLHPESIRTSAGMGIRWLLGGQVPLRLDYGFKLERRCQRLGYADPSNATLADEPVCIQHESLGTLHFGFLYTF